MTFALPFSFSHQPVEVRKESRSGLKVSTARMTPQKGVTLTLRQMSSSAVVGDRDLQT